MPSDAIVAGAGYPGIERIGAQFRGNVFAPHRHDTYALGVTLAGVQTFRYRGAARFSLPGQVIVLHPDEIHDGGAGTDDGLAYRMLYLEPALLHRARGEAATGLPFVAEPVVMDAALRAVLMGALGELDAPLDELVADDLIVRIADGLARHDRSTPASGARSTLSRASVLAARDHIASNSHRPVSSRELEAVTGLDRFLLARQFRACLGTTPHRFWTMRRLERARALISRGEPLAEAAAAAGFADQSHLNRSFKKAFGLTPGRWAALALPAGMPRIPGRT